jgi:hypothetical protein
MSQPDIVQVLRARAHDTAQPEHWLLALPVGALRTVALSLGANRGRIERASRPELLGALWRRTAWRVFAAAERPLALRWGGTFRSAVYIEVRTRGRAAVYAVVVYPPAAADPPPRLILACGLRRERRKEVECP